MTYRDGGSPENPPEVLAMVIPSLVGLVTGRGTSEPSDPQIIPGIIPGQSNFSPKKPSIRGTPKMWEPPSSDWDILNLELSNGNISINGGFSSHV